MKNTLWALVVSLLLTPMCGSAAAGPLVYVVNAYQQFGVVDLESGSFVPIGAPTPEPLANLVWSGGRLFGISVSGNLVTVNPATGAVTVIGQTGLGFNALDLAGDRGRLFLTDFNNNIYSVDPSTGTASFLQTTGIAPDPTVPFTLNGDGTFNLCDESLYGIGGSLYATFDSFAINPDRTNPNFLSIAAAVKPMLYRIDPATGVASLVGPTDLQLGSTVAVDGKVYAFRLVITDFVDGFPVGSSQLVSLDLASGTTTFLRNIDPAAGPIFGAAPVLSRANLSKQ